MLVLPTVQFACSPTLARSPPSNRSMPGKRLMENRFWSLNSKSRLSSFGMLRCRKEPAFGAATSCTIGSTICDPLTPPSRMNGQRISAAMVGWARAVSVLPCVP